MRLESQLRGELHATRPAASKERVSDSYVARCCQRVVSAVPASGGVRRADIADEVRQQRTGKVRVIEQIEEFGAKLHHDVLRQFRVFKNREIELLETRPL